MAETAGRPEDRFGAGDTVPGRAEVVDGDTLRIGTERIRLHAMDAPERGQRCEPVVGRPADCGALASRALENFVAGRTVTCTGRNRDRYGRLVAVCRAGGTDLGGWMVAQGLAVAYRRFGLDYVAAEAAARAAGRGFWAGSGPGDPAAVRAGAQGSVPSSRSGTVRGSPEGCVIAGNISAGGRIYHLPGQRDYDRVRIDEARGERWFCTEAEARAAGWRPALR